MWFGCKASPFDYQAVAPHPRLWLTGGQEEAVKKAIAEYPFLAAYHRRIMDRCEEFISEPPAERRQEGKRLLGVSRTVMMRVFYLSYGYRMTEDLRYAERAEQEMLAACSFTDWNPSHFLDVGEMTMGLAIGYDWLYDQLSTDARKAISRAIVEKAFAAAETEHAAFYKSATNWNQVCNGGLVCGALAILEEEPLLAEKIIDKCLRFIPLALECYAPDGGYPEGFGYWTYGTAYQVMLNSALESALGHDAGLSEVPGFLRSARYIQFMTAPGGDCFNFADASPTAFPNIMMFWFALKTGDTSLMRLERRYLDDPELKIGEYMEDRFLPCLMIYASKVDLRNIPPPPENFWHNGGQTPVFVYRGGWDSPEDTYLGIKGGSASTSHAHMDAGSFIYERAGVRWAMDLGMQDYYSLESRGVDLWNMDQDSQRWNVFRIGSSAHNTITLDGANHRVDGFAPLNRVYRSDIKGAETDLSAVLGDAVKKCLRRVTLDRHDNLEIADVVKNGNAETTLRWTMCTPASAEIVDRNTILLTENGKMVLLTVESPKLVELFVISNDPPGEYDYPNPGTCRVGYRIRLSPREKVEIKVKLELKDLNIEL